MKAKELKNLREKEINDLEKQVVELKQKLMVLTPKMYAGQISNLKERKILRRDIAQTLGIITELKNKKVENTK